MKLSAVLLAGGESRRMQREKATVMFDGEPLWQRQIRLLRQVEPAHIFISARTDRAWRPRKIELLLDTVPSRGPMSGICAALTRIRTSHLLVLAVDMPFLAADDLLRLVSLAKKGCGAVPLIGRRAEPLAAIYPRETQQKFAAALSSDDTSLQRLVRRLAGMGMVELVDLSPADAERFRSVNTPEDLSARPVCR
jgi:molybdenum cofactor guanylyltransferase